MGQWLLLRYIVGVMDSVPGGNEAWAVTENGYSPFSEL